MQNSVVKHPRSESASESDGAAQRFPSRIDTWLVVMIVAAFLAAPIVMLADYLVHGRNAELVPLIGILAVLMATSAPLVWLFRTTDYTVTESELAVRSGPLRWNLPLADIHEIRASRSVLSAPALSLHRIEVLYGNHGSVVISPDDRKGFILALRERRSAPVRCGHDFPIRSRQVGTECPSAKSCTKIRIREFFDARSRLVLATSATFTKRHFGYAIAGGRMRVTDSGGAREVDLVTGSSF